MLDRLMRRREVEKVTGLSRPTIYVMINKGLFPRPCRIGKRAVAWRQSEIEEWMASREAA